MNDMSAVVVPKSDQLNADSLLAGPITIKITAVKITPGAEQPCAISFDGDAGKPYKCCKSMARVLVNCWGPDANNYIGRSLTLYCDPTVTWGGMAVGGIRISHMSDISGAQVMALTATRGNKKAFKVLPLVIKTETGPVVTEIGALRTAASAAADKGTKSLNEFWSTLSKTDRLALKDSMPSFKATAAEVDVPSSLVSGDPLVIENAGQAEEIPFPGDRP